MNYLLRFDDPAATQTDISGGKGANLALLTQRGFVVPPGFVVTAGAYREFIRTHDALAAQLSALPVNDPSALQRHSERLRQGLQELPLPDALVAEVHAMLANQEQQAFAVRSSSTMEDLAGAAFAGQHDTFLNITGAAQILDRIKACFLSLWHDRAIAYRQQQGFNHALAEMAVVVQSMIPCEVAGVGFSINPVSGDIGELVINANHGLGESVVSGDGEVDQFELDKKTRAVRRSRIARKTRKVIAVAGGTQEIETHGDEAELPCLDATQLGQLADLLLRVERDYRFPQDIEWGFAGGKLWLLQSRPITTIPPRWTRDESAERFPNVISPLTWDFVESGFHESLAYSFRLMDYPPFSGKWFASFGHYIYGNQNAVALYGSRAPFVFTNFADLLPQIPRIREEFHWVQELPVLWMRDLDGYLIRLGEFAHTSLDSMMEAQLWRHVREVVDHGARYFRPNIAISIMQGVACRVLLRLITLAIGEEEARGLFDALLAWCETKTGQINKELFEMARQIRATPGMTAMLDGSDSRSIIATNALARFPEFHARFEKFLADHGHRETDFDAYQPPWADAPWVVLDNLRLILQTPMDVTPAHREREVKVAAHRAEMRLFNSVPEPVKFFVHEVLRLARAYTSLDDLEHYQTTRLNRPLRRGLRALGTRLVKRDVLAEPMDIFFAHLAQIEEAVSTNTPAGWNTLRDRVREQKAAYHADASRRLDWILGEKPAEIATGEHMQGLPGSPGQAAGEVFVVNSPDDFARFPKGAVLVARTTNPTWTPLFYSACAVITESGGPLSHGAVTAREMRIPAVMSVRGCLSRLSNGQRVTVDGTRGQIVIV